VLVTRYGDLLRRKDCRRASVFYFILNLLQHQPSASAAASQFLQFKAQDVLQTWVRSDYIVLPLRESVYAWLLKEFELV